MATIPFNTFVAGLPVASALTGTEAVPLVQGGVTSQTTSAALSGGFPVGTSAGASVSVLKSGPIPTRLITIGDSLTITSNAKGGPYGASSGSQMWPQLIAANYGFGGPAASTLAAVTITGTSGQFSCTSTTLTIGDLLKISGTFGGSGSITGYVNPTTYQISATNGTTTFTLTTLTGNPGGTAIVTTAGTPTGLIYNHFGYGPNGTNFLETGQNGTTSDLQFGFSAVPSNANNSQLAILATDLIMGNLFFNNMRSWGPEPAPFMLDIQQAAEALIAWFAVPESAKVRAITSGTTTINPAVAVTGSWAYYAVTAGTQLNQLFIRSGGTAGSTATFMTPIGDTVYIWYARTNPLQNMQVMLSIDGGPTLSVGGNITYGALLTQQWELACLRISGLSNQVHTVVFTTGNTGVYGAFFVVAAVAAFSSISIASIAPAAVIGNCQPLIPLVAGEGFDNSTGYQASSLITNTASTAAISVTGSPFSYTAPSDGTVTINAGTVSAVTITRSGGGAVTLGTTAGQVYLARGDVLTTTYTGLPTMTFFPQTAQGNFGPRNVQLYNDCLARAINNLAADGLRVVLVDTSSGMNVSSMTISGTTYQAPDASSDFIHFSNTGNWKMYQRYKKVLDKVFNIT